MYISLDWLKEFTTIPKGITPEKLANDLTLKTAEVESVSQGNELLNGVVIGFVKEMKAHPNADKLRLAVISQGPNKPDARLVCGGQNLREGMYVAYAAPGCKVKWHGEGEPVVLEKAKIRGEESEGMICASCELGLTPAESEGHEDILDLSPLKPTPGTPLAELLNLTDTVLEFDNKSLTHRPDLWGIYGIAREVSAIYKTPFKELKPKPKLPTTGDRIKVDIHSYELCPRYCGVIIKNIRVQPSPDWMKKRLEAVGHKSYNNIVDVTNYISSELGQPLHAFDKNLVKKGIVVRTANKGERIKTLDGETRKLKEEMLVIADHEKPLAIAGVMGGDGSSINESTTEIIIESANFSGANIRRTATTLGLRTESVQRFEKQLDPALAELAMLRAIELILKVSPGAVVAGPITDNQKFDTKLRTITINLDRTISKIGVPIPKKEIKDILNRLGFKTTESGTGKSSTKFSEPLKNDVMRGNKELSTEPYHLVRRVGSDKVDEAERVFQRFLKVTVPSFRAQKDISTEDDIVEEIARIYGYDNIPAILPELPTKLPIKNTERKQKHDLRRLLTLGLNFNEITTYSFYSKQDLENCGLNEDTHVQIENFLSEDQTHMRTSLIPNFLKKIYLNSKYLDEFRLFEIGRTFKKASRAPASIPTASLHTDTSTYFPLEEKWIVGAVVRRASASQSVASSNPFYEAKGSAMEILKHLNLPPTKLIKDTDAPYAHPVASAIMMTFKGETIGRIFTLHPKIAKAFDLEKLKVAMFELNYSLISKLEKIKPHFNELPKFPSIIIDISVLADETTTIETLQKAITNADKHLIQDVTLFDLYKGENIGKGKKSATFKVVLQSADRTLTDEEMKQVQEKIFTNLKTAGGTIRGL